MGVALTGSRAGALELGLLALAAALATPAGHRFTAPRPGGAGRVVRARIADHPVAGPVSELTPVRQLNESASPRERLNLLRMMLAAIAERPWTGWGWNQVLSAHAALSDRFALHVSGQRPQLGVGSAGLVWHSTRRVVDCGFVGMVWRIDRIANAEQALIYTALAVFLLHAMLELPHMLTYFQLPVAVMLAP
jgi:hypothetical protein